MTFPTVTEVPPVLTPVTPNTFVFAVVRPGAPRPSVSTASVSCATPASHRT
jgi:hypothetical protein